MATALRAYLTSTTDTLLTTSRQLSATAPAAETSFASAKLGKSTGWIILDPITQNSTFSTTEPSPNGHGWLYDVTTLEGQTIAAGSWSASIKVSASSTLGAYFHVRAYIRSSSGVYTQIGDLQNGTSVSVTSTASVVSIPAASLSAANFNTGDKLYIDLVAQIATASGSTTTTMSVYFNGGTNESLVTPGYAPTVPDFTISMANATTNAAYGSGVNATNTVNLAATNSTLENVTLSVSGIPSGATSSFATNPVSNLGTSTTTDVLTISPGTAATGTYTITVTGTGSASNAPVHSTTFSLVIKVDNIAPYSIIKTVSTTATTSPASLALGSTTPGNLLVLLSDRVTSVTGVTDPLALSWTQVGNTITNVGAGLNIVTYMSSSSSNASGETLSISFTTASGVTAKFTAIEIGGFGSLGGVVDVSTSSVVTGGTSITTSTTPLSAGDFALYFSSTEGVTPSTESMTTGWDSIGTYSGTNTNQIYGKYISGTSLVSTTETFSPSGNYESNLILFKSTPPSFSLTVPANVKAFTGGVTQNTSTSVSGNGATQNITLSLSGLPSGATLQGFDTNPVVNPVSGGTYDGIYINPGNAVPGTYTVTLTGSSSASIPSQSVTFTLTVAASDVVPYTIVSSQLVLGTSAASPVTFTYPSNTSGNLLIMILTNVTSVSGITDTVSNTWTQVPNTLTNSATGKNMVMYACLNAKASSGTNTVTLAFSSTVQPRCALLEIGGFSPGTALVDASASAIVTSGSSITVSATPTVTGDLAIYSATLENAFANETGMTTGWDYMYQYSTSNQTQTYGKYINNTTAVSVTESWDTIQAYGAAIALFKTTPAAVVVASSIRRTLLGVGV